LPSGKVAIGDRRKRENRTKYRTPGAEPELADIMRRFRSSEPGKSALNWCGESSIVN
jgi:hypothetical protein